MPLSRKRDRERKRRERVQPNSNLAQEAIVQPTPRIQQQPSRPPADDRLLVARQALESVKSKGISPQIQHRGLQKVTIPELDADGNPIPDIE